MGLEDFSQIIILLSDWKMCFVLTVLFWHFVNLPSVVSQGIPCALGTFYVVLV